MKQEWTYIVKRVDIDTGELITKKEAKLNYKKINTEKKITDYAKRICEYTITFRRDAQLKFDF